MNKFGLGIITVSAPAGFDINRRIQPKMADIISAMSTQTGRWATEQFKDGNKTMLGWMNLGAWRKTGPITQMMKEIREFAKQVQLEKEKGETTDIVFIGQGGSIECIKTLYATFRKTDHAPNIHILDTIDQEVIAGLKSNLPFKTTRFVILSKSMTTAEVHSLYKLFFDECIAREVPKEETAANFTLITDYGKACFSPLGKLEVSDKVREPFGTEVLERGFGNVFYIQPESGGRYSWDTAVGILPSMIMGQETEEILKGAELAEELAKNPEPAANPAAQYGYFKYEMQLAGRKRPTLILPEEISSYGPWDGQLDTESLGKTRGRSSLTIDHEDPAKDPAVYTRKRFFVRVKMGGNDNRFDADVKKLEQTSIPVFTITLQNSSPGKVDAKDFGAFLKFSEFATAIAGYLMGVNPVNQPGVEDYKKAQEAGLSSVFSEEAWKKDEFIRLKYDTALGNGKISEARLNEVLKNIGNESMAARYTALMYLAAKEYSKDYFVMIIFKRLALHPSMVITMNEWREAVRTVLHVDTLGEEAPCILHAKQQGFQQGENSGFFTIVRFANYGDEKIKIPLSGEAIEKYGGEKTFEDLIKAQSGGTLEALSAAGQPGVMVEIKDTKERSISKFNAFVKDALDYLGMVY